MPVYTVVEEVEYQVEAASAEEAYDLIVNTMNRDRWLTAVRDRRVEYEDDRPLQEGTDA